MTTTTRQPTHAPTTDQGPGTRRRLLDAAAELFATRGYRNVAIRDICEQACANIAAVNYHFGGKDNLHLAAMQHARQRALKEDAQQAGPTQTGPLPPAEKLRRHLHAMFARAFADGPAGWYMQMVLRELADPTPAMPYAIDENIAPYHRKLQAIVGQLMQQDPDTDAVKDTAAAILATALYYHTCRPVMQQLRPGFVFNAPTAERLADQITNMALTGIAG